MSTQTVSLDPEQSEVTAAPKIHFFSLRWRLILWFTLLFTIVFGVAFYWFFTFAESQALSKIQEDLVNTIQGSVVGVDGDLLTGLARNGQANAAGFSDDPDYVRLMDWLDTVHKIEPRAWPYVFTLGASSKEGIFVADISARYNPDRSTKFLESYTSDRDVPGLNGLEIRQQNGQIATYSDKWGRWVSAYAPVKNAAGQTVGAIGIDFDASYVDLVRSSILNTIVVAFAVAYAAIFILVMLVSGILIRPIQNLTRMAERIGEGDYEQDLTPITSSRWRDEIGVLASVFAVMIGKVYQREQQLRVEVAKLRIEIDESKRQSQVDEIVETDFFRELRTKANEMRNRRGRSQS